jgi:hypothetical protein
VFLRAAYPKVSPTTWNRNLATLKSFCAYCRRQGWMVARSWRLSGGSGTSRCGRRPVAPVV